MNNRDDCITRTIDKYSNIGNRYYHNVQQDEVKMRPRVPMRYDFNDVEVLKVSANDADVLRRHYYKSAINPEKLFKLSRSSYSILNTILLYLLTSVLVVICVLNMRKVVKTMQTDDPPDNEKIRLGVAFVMSFLIVVFLTSYLSLSFFELYRNYHHFPTYNRGNFVYKNINFRDGKARTVVLLFVLVCLLLSIAETINLFMVNKNTSLLLLLVPATIGLLIVVEMTM